jgi:hypothetical protein
MAGQPAARAPAHRCPDRETLDATVERTRLTRRRTPSHAGGGGLGILRVASVHRLTEAAGRIGTPDLGDD